jgi:hypothetical protein
VAAGARAVADSAIAPVVAAAAAAAALLGSARANIAVQRYILGDAACGNDIGASRRQETHDFLSERLKCRPRGVYRRVPRVRRDVYTSLVVIAVVVFPPRQRAVDALQTATNNRFSIAFSDQSSIIPYSLRNIPGILKKDYSTSFSPYFVVSL